MQYWFSLKVRGVKTPEQFTGLEKELESWDLFRYVFEDGDYHVETGEAEFPSFEEAAWIRHEVQMRAISKHLHEMTFELAVNDGMNYWLEYYHNGAQEICSGEIVYDTPKTIKWEELIPI